MFREYTSNVQYTCKITDAAPWTNTYCQEKDKVDARVPFRSSEEGDTDITLIDKRVGSSKRPNRK